jgi:predicted house-cleaning noncanonical NTP pyrophosphatase (MazG superfamily)
VAAVLDGMTTYGKLVRDRVPQIIRDAGKIPICRTMSDEDYRNALRAKIVEEAAEVADASAESLIAELADLAEVLDALLEAYHLTREQLSVSRRSLSEQRGAFAKKIFLERVEDGAAGNSAIGGAAPTEAVER